MCHYITNFNRKRLFSLIPFKVLLDCRFEGEVYKGNTPFWLNKMEVAKLLAYQEYCKNPGLFLSRYKQYIDLNRNHHFTRYDVPPAYHSNPRCENLRSSYTYIVVPEQIKEKGAEVIKHYKEFVRENYDLIERGKTDVLEFRINAKFQVKTKLIQGSRPNSGITDVDIEHIDVEQCIKEKVTELGEWIKRDSSKFNIIKKFGRQTYKIEKSGYDEPFIMLRYTDKYIREVLKEFNDNFKQPLIDLFNSYYEATSGEEKSAIESDILDQLGFHPCTKCAAN